MKEHSLFPIKLHDVMVKRRTKTLLGPFSLTIGETLEERITMVIGPNGAGKTTLLKLLHRLERPDHGHVIWGATETPGNLPISFVFQSPVMLRRTVLQNAAYPLLIKGVAKGKANDAAKSWLSRVGLGEFANQRANLLSGGEKQKLALARALSTDPELLVLDEPTANLDSAATLEIEALLRDVSEAGTRIIMASHDMGQVRRLASSIVFLNHGKLVEHASGFRGPENPATTAFLKGEIVL